MNKKARIINDVAVDVIAGNPADFFHPDIASQFVSVPDDVQAGSRRVGLVWNDPEVVVAPENVVIPQKLTPPQFKMCFTVTEEIAIDTLAATDPVVRTALKRLDDPRLTEVDLGLQSVQDLIDYLAKTVPLSTERARQIKVGQVI